MLPVFPDSSRFARFQANSILDLAPILVIIACFTLFLLGGLLADPEGGIGPMGWGWLIGGLIGLAVGLPNETLALRGPHWSVLTTLLGAHLGLFEGFLMEREQERTSPSIKQPQT